jgi:hypothetical protein
VQAGPKIRYSESLSERGVGVMDRVGVGAVVVPRAARVAPRCLRSAEHVVGVGESGPWGQPHTKILAGSRGCGIWTLTAGWASAAISRQGGEAVLLDGTLIPTRRRTGTANRANYNGKHKKHGLLFLALTDQAGNLIWISAARRGAASEITAARHDHLAAHLRTAGLGALADLGFTGLDPDPEDPVIITGYKSTRTCKTTPAQRQANQALSAARAPVEHGFSDLKHWRILTRLRLDPAKATILLRALLVLTRQHTTR